MTQDNVLWRVNYRPEIEAIPTTLDELLQEFSYMNSGTVIQVRLQDELRSAVSYGSHATLLDASLRAWNIPFRYGAPEPETSDYKLVGAGRFIIKDKVFRVYDKSIGYNITPDLESTKLIKVANPDWKIFFHPSDTNLEMEL